MLEKGSRGKRDKVPYSFEIEAQVGDLYCQGKKVKDIVEVLNRQHGLRLKRWDVHGIIRRAAESKRFRYQPREDLILERQIREKCDWLRLVVVARATDYGAIANDAAEKILEIICDPAKTGHEKEREVHIGFAGGSLLELTARVLADRIRATEPRRLRPLCLHALVASFGDDPAANPNSFLGYFTSRNKLPVPTRLIGLPTPGFVHVDAAAKLREIEGIKDAYDQIDKLDLVVTSAGGHWTEGCSYLHKLHKTAGDLESLAAAECVGDLMWRPIGARGPIELDHGFRAMTLIDLSQLPQLIRQGSRVMLVLAPCGTCRKPKEDLLDSVLRLREHREHHITDLVVDSGTATALAAKWAAAQAGIGRTAP